MTIKDFIKAHLTNLVMVEGLDFNAAIRRLTNDSALNRLSNHFNLPVEKVEANIFDVAVDMFTMEQAIFFALEGPLGTRSSVPALMAEATRIFANYAEWAAPHDQVSYAMAVAVRSKYRAQHNLVEDCRTYDTQFCRDMRRVDYAFA